MANPSDDDYVAFADISLLTPFTSISGDTMDNALNDMQDALPSIDHSKSGKVEVVDADTAKEKAIRDSWIEGSKVQVYSKSASKWFNGTIIGIQHDEEGEWLEVFYSVSDDNRIKQVPRYDEDAVRPRRHSSE